jgi:hypothetical protein
MKITRTETTPSGKKRLVAALGKEELALIYGLAKNALTHMPRSLSTETAIGRLKSFCRAYEKFQREERGIPPEFYSALADCDAGRVTAMFKPGTDELNVP